MAEKVKIKTEYGTISATPAQAEAWKAREERDNVQKERIAAVRENARAMNRYRQEKETAKGQRRAREERTKGGYDATPTGRFGQPVESFWTAEAPQMPEMRPVPQLPEIPQLPIPALADRMKTPQAIDFYNRVQSEMNPYINTNLPSIDGLGIGPAPVGSYKYSGYPYAESLGYSYPFTERTITGGTPIRQSSFLNIGPYRTGYGLPVFPYYPKVL